MAAFSTYADLQATIATFLIRADQAGNIPAFITLAEARLNREIRERNAELDVALTGVPGLRTVTLPVAFSEALNLWITYPSGTDRDPLRYVDPARLNTSTIAGRPYDWTIDGPNLAFERPCDQAYAFTLRCIEKYALSNSVTTNTLLQDYPDAYLYAALCEAGPMLRDADLVSAYEQKLQATIAQINAKDARSRSNQTLSTEPGMLTYAGRRTGYDVNSDGFR